VTTTRTDAATRPLRFGPGGRFELRPAEYRLLVDGQPAALGGRALDLLIALAARPHQVLTKSELLDTVWRGVVVEENNLRVQINTLRRLLGEDAIATVPGRGYRLSVVLHSDPAPQASQPAGESVHEPAPQQRLFGRADELERLQRRLHDDGGCVTLVGMPGVGKSSLARAASARWPGRSAWVDLAPLTQGSQIAGAIARALDAQLDERDPAPQLLRLLTQDEPLLLVLDNAEHLIEQCAAWVSQLRDTPRLHVLATSQLPLAVSGEQVMRLEPLTVADGDPGRDGAVAMLIDRITAADSRFQVAPDTLPLLVALCRQLDGLPLALEMAAARVPLMGLRAVHDALAERFALLSRGRRDSPARHRTLHDALAWSYGLLGEPEQRLFRALGVFAGGFTLDLAVTLTSDEHVGRWDIVDGLAALAERSLVSVSSGDPPRYRLPETMRAYALEKLSAAADGTDALHSLRRRHAAAVLALFAQGDSEPECLAEMDNAREAFLWAREHDLAVAAQLSARAANVIGFTVWRQEVTDWMLLLQPAMQQPRGHALPLQTQALWWSMLAYVLNVRRDKAAQPAAKQAATLWRQLDNATELRMAMVHWVRSITEPGPELDAACAELQQLAQAAPARARLSVQGALAEAARVRGDNPELLACREEELRLARELGWNEMAQAAETNVCAALIELGRHAEAAERARALIQRIDAAANEDNANLPWALYMLGESLLRLEAYAEARAVVPRMLAAEKRFGISVAWRWILAVVAAQGQLESAGRLLGYVQALWSVRKDSPDLDEQSTLHRVRSTVEARLGAEAAAALAAEGRAMDDDSAAALAVLAQNQA